MPLMFDMPLDQLQRYQGRNPRPADFDAYWETALREVAATDPAATFAAADFSCPGVRGRHLYFTGVGGARIHAKLLEPERAAAPHPAVLVFHGYSGDSGDWVDKVPYVMAGMTVAALDCRGQGGLSEDVGGVKGTTLNGHIIRGLEDAPERLLFRQIYLDTVQLARVVGSLPGVDPARLGATGGSQGGGLTLAAAALVPAIRRCAPVFPFLSDYQRVWEMDLAKDAYAELRDYFRRHDPLHRTEAEVFRRLGYIDVQHLAPRIRARTRFTISLMDQICPPSTQMAAYNRIAAAKELVVYPDFAHEGLPGNGDANFMFLCGLLNER